MGPGGEPQAPAGPRRPAVPAEASPCRPSSLVSNPKQSTECRPDLKARVDDVGRGFLYAPPAPNEPPTPPINSGPRMTKGLSPRAVRQIKGAAMKADKLGLPLVTFITFTVREEERAAFERGDFILGREMKRMINGLNEWFRRRGMPLLVYVWVAENVRNENPHVHMLTNHTVPKAEFRTFAAHLESLWSHGWAHVERVKNPKQAGRYMMKALAYTLKAQERHKLVERAEGGEDKSGQGVIIGQRYGIPRLIMPRYETIDLHDCGEAACELRRLQSGAVNTLQEYAPDVWLTEFGLTFRSGEDLAGLSSLLKRLAPQVMDE